MPNISGYKFRSAAKSYGNTLAQSVPVDKEYFQEIEIDIDKFPQLEGELGDTLTLVIKAKVCDKRLSNDRKCQHMEVVRIGVPSSDTNEADKTYARLTGSEED